VGDYMTNKEIDGINGSTGKFTLAFRSRDKRPGKMMLHRRRSQVCARSVRTCFCAWTKSRVQTLFWLPAALR
jgi:hypothetical protein